MKDIWPDGLTKCLILEIEELGGQVIVKGQENPLTGGKRNRKKLTKNFNVRHKKSVVVFEPDLKLKKLEIEKLGGQVIVKGQENPLTGGKRNPQFQKSTTTTTTATTTTTTTTAT